MVVRRALRGILRRPREGVGEARIRRAGIVPESERDVVCGEIEPCELVILDNLAILIDLQDMAIPVGQDIGSWIAENSVGGPVGQVGRLRCRLICRKASKDASREATNRSASDWSSRGLVRPGLQR